ncbi:MAG: 2-oxoisovalerate ferredoxin oxidoreductase alpha subunit [Candidatus Poribacteria bacterium]|nr:2-oxoisovalerate ferredoxin oxidoreductase alpha subunit [Candidatus Poribacteria bacterium]
MKKLIMGNHAAAYGAKLAKAEVVAAYPITPQTQTVEKIAEMVASGEMKAEYIKVESEHSAMAACIGASSTGARAFTATSSQGLALMHELLHWASGARLPIVMTNVNRAMAPGWNIWSEQNDSLSQRDTGWLQFYCESNQEVLDTVIQAYKVAERISLPVMICLDGFSLSHTYEGVDIPDQDEIDAFLPPYDPEYKLDVDDPKTFGALIFPDWYYEMRYKMQSAMEEAKSVIMEVDEEFGEKFGRRYGMVEQYKCDGAKTIMITSGTIASTAKDTIDKLQEEGENIGLLRVRVFRPFPKEEIRKLLEGVERIGVIDRNISFGHEGIFFSEVKASLYDTPNPPKAYDFIAGLGGRDVTPVDIENMIHLTKSGDIDEVTWYSLKKDLLEEENLVCSRGDLNES